MINKKIDIRAGEKTYSAWFNNYAIQEIAKVFGVNIEDIGKTILKKLNENFMVLVSDLVYIGIKGECLAKGKPMELTYEEVREITAVANQEDLIQVWRIFQEHTGMSKESETEKKKD